MGERAANVLLLRKGVDAHRDALKVVSSDTNLKRIAEGWGSLGLSLSNLGEVSRDFEVLKEAVESLETALSWEIKNANMPS
jgi:hypothetical protein